MLSWKVWLVIALVMAALIGANYYQYRHIQTLNADLGGVKQQNTQLTESLKTERDQVRTLTEQRDHEAAIREKRDREIRQIGEQMEAERRAWRRRLDAEAGDWMATDIPEPVDQRLCELVPCAPSADEGGSPNDPR